MFKHYSSNNKGDKKMAVIAKNAQLTIPKTSITKRIKKNVNKNKYIYIMLAPVLLYYLVFQYQPMYGALIAFKHFSPVKGILGSPWAGLEYFRDFFSAHYFWRLIKNTFIISIYNIVFGFPAPVILAVLLNEISSRFFKRTVQTVTYLPHFISMVVICGMILNFLSRDGVVNQLLKMAGSDVIPFMIKSEWFRMIYISTNIWQEIGWDSIIYLAALSTIDQQLYEACRIDGGGRFRQFISITVPGIAPTVIIMLILRVGRMMNIGHEKILLLYNSSIYETADVISTFVYRKGLLEMNFSYSAAVGLFNSAINFALIIMVNRISRKISDTSLW